MHTTELCTSKCTYNMPYYTYEDKDTIPLELIDANKDYCVKATLLNFDSDQNTSTASDLSQGVITNISDYNYSIYNNILLFNVATDKIKDFTDSTYKFINRDSYIADRFISFKNLKIVKDDSVDLIDKTKKGSVKIKGLYSASEITLNTTVTVSESEEHVFTFEIVSGNHVIRIIHKNNMLYLQLSCFLDNKETIIYNKFLNQTVYIVRYGFEIHKDFTNSLLKVKVTSDGVVSLDISFNYRLIVGNPLFDEISLEYRVSSINKLQLDATDLVFYPFDKNGIYNYHLMLDYSSILDKSTSKNRVYFYSSHSTADLIRTKHPVDKESFTSTLHYLDYSLEPSDIYFNKGYETYYDNVKDHVKLTTTAFGIYLIAHYDKNNQDFNHINIEKISDSDIYNYKYPVIYTQNTDDFDDENIIIIAQGDNIVIDRCYGLKLKLTNMGMKLFYDTFGSGVKASISFIGINYTFRLNKIPRTAEISDGSGISVVPSKIVSFLKFDDIELYNYEKNRYVFIKATILNILEFLEIGEDAEGFDYIYLFDIALYITYNGKIYRLTNSDVNIPYKVKINKSLDLLLTISY